MPSTLTSRSVARESFQSPPPSCARLSDSAPPVMVSVPVWFMMPPPNAPETASFVRKIVSTTSRVPPRFRIPPPRAPALVSDDRGADDPDAPAGDGAAGCEAAVRHPPPQVRHPNSAGCGTASDRQACIGAADEDAGAAPSARRQHDHRGPSGRESSGCPGRGRRGVGTRGCRGCDSLDRRARALEDDLARNRRERGRAGVIRRLVGGREGVGRRVLEVDRVRTVACGTLPLRTRLKARLCSPR